MQLLKKISSLLPTAHKEAVKEVFEQLKKTVPSLTPREVEFEAQRLVGKVARSAGNRLFDPVKAEPGTRISSAQHNDHMEDAFVDIKGIYQEMANVGAIQSSHVAATESDFAKARAAILKLINDARVFSIRSKFPEFDDIKVIDFNISNNASKRSPIAQVDPESRLLKLPHLGKRRNHLRRRSLRTTQVFSEVLAEGQVGHLGKQFQPERAADSRPDTFWAEVVYTDAQFQVDYNRWSPNEKGEHTDTILGPVVKLTLEFSNAEAINQVRILPFSNFPVKVLEITYRPSQSSLLRRSIDGFEKEESLDWVEFNFETIFATDIQIVLAQDSYREFIVHVPKHVLYATDFMIRLFETRGQEFATNFPLLDDIKAGGNSEIYDQALGDLASVIGEKELDKLPTTEIDLAGKTILSVGESLAAFNPSLKPLLEEVSAFTEAVPKAAEDEIQTFNKYEYVVGAREVECNYITYSPIGFYESPKMQPASTISNVEIEVDERHPVFESQYGTYRRTSTEWSIEFAEDREVAIYPRNFAEGALYPVVGEFLDIDPVSFMGLSRFPSQVAFAVVRENDKLLSAGMDYELLWNDSFDGKLQITVDKNSFNKKKVYTVDYYAKPSAASIDVLSKFNDKPLPAPETFDKTGPDNEINLTNFPFVNYSIVNSTDFTFSEDGNFFEYKAPSGAYSTGEVIIHPTWIDESGVVVAQLTGILAVTGQTTGGTDPAFAVTWNTLDTTYLTDPYRYYLKLANVPGAIYEVSTLDSASGLTLAETPVLFTGLVGNEIASGDFSGNITGDIVGEAIGTITVPYSLEIVYKAGDQIFGFDNVLYEPISVLVGGVKARNTTNYQTLEQPAFTIAATEDSDFEFIHDGNQLFFNQSVSDAEILVDYRWMTKYAKVNCTLRTNKVVSPTITPQVDEYRLLMNTTVL